MANKIEMTSMERVLTTLGFKEPDRVPFFLCLSMYGAKEFNISIKEYFSKAENVVEGQLKMREKYRHDCIYTFFYAPIEVEAWGGEVIYFDDGPPNSGTPIIKKNEDIDRIQVPEVRKSLVLKNVLKATELLKKNVGDKVPIIGVVMSPFSLPVMQLGFEKYLNLLYFDKVYFQKLMQINEKFCIEWANAQLDAGATAICYFDPFASPMMIPRELYLKTGFHTAKRTISSIKGPTATHLASGRAIGILDDLFNTGTNIVGVSAEENIGDIKKGCYNKLTVLGNFNGIEMRHWNAKETETKVKETIALAGKGGGFILSDNHGEIPWQVPEDVLLRISEAVHKWGRYPLQWVDK
ncbi:MAG: uroporphyrinogen decarboxylase family protein [Eubacteriales bacterium]